MDKKYGVYICEGCGIGEALDIEKLCEVPKEEGLAVKTCPVLCGKEGVELLKKDIADEGVNTLVLAACSRRVLFDVFRFDGCIVDRVNLRAHQLRELVGNHQHGGETRIVGRRFDDFQQAFGQ